MQILQPPSWVRPKGYANGIKTKGTMIFVAGQVGWNAQEQFEHSDMANQVGQALRNIVAILAEGGAKPEHIVRMTWFVTDTEEYLASTKEIGAHYKAIIGKHFPVMSVIGIKGLIEHGGKVEIEATAVIPD